MNFGPTENKYHPPHQQKLASAYNEIINLNRNLDTRNDEKKSKIFLSL